MAAQVKPYAFTPREASYPELLKALRPSIVHAVIKLAARIWKNRASPAFNPDRYAPSRVHRASRPVKKAQTAKKSATM